MTRILQAPVAPLFPAVGDVQIMLFGEAPGPLGADKSGIPFWGDKAGLPVYRALEATGRAEVPAEAYVTWSGERFKRMGLVPTLSGVALSNAYPSCPTKDGQKFCAPSDAQLKNATNLGRLQAELATAQGRAERRLRVIALGRRAAWILKRLETDFELCELPHPSAQGLLQAAPGKGKGMKLSDLQRAWEDKLQELLTV